MAIISTKTENNELNGFDVIVKASKFFYLLKDKGIDEKFQKFLETLGDKGKEIRYAQNDLEATLDSYSKK